MLLIAITFFSDDMFDSMVLFYKEETLTFIYLDMKSETVIQMAFSPCVALIHPDKFKWPALYGHESERQNASEHRTTESLCSETQYFQQLGPG